MTGLTQSLALTAAMASTLLSGIQPPPSPVIEDQEIVSAPQPPSEEKMSGRAVEAVSRILSTAVNPRSDFAIKGIDISSHQHNAGTDVNADTVVSSGGMDFAFIKATEGTGYINPYFRKDVVNFMKTKIPIGFYHYARPTANSDNGRQQARFFVEVTGIDKGVKSFDPVLDLEESEGLSAPEIAAWTRNFVDEIKKLTGRNTIIYTYPSFWFNQMQNTQEFNYLPLWIANYNNSTSPGLLPGGWKNWTFWQYTSDELVDGVIGVVDANAFAGKKEDLQDMYHDSLSTRKQTEKTVIVKPPRPQLPNATKSIQEESRKKREEQFKTLMETFN